jgi:hypothetical protein
LVALLLPSCEWYKKYSESGCSRIDLQGMNTRFHQIVQQAINDTVSRDWGFANELR